MDTQIRDRAYALWEAAGRPEGQDEQFWFAAAAEMAQAAEPFQTAEPEAAAKPVKAKARTPRTKKAA